MATLQIGQQLVVEVEEDANSFEEQRGAAWDDQAWSGVGASTTKIKAARSFNATAA